jgi:hypothetical protein
LDLDNLLLQTGDFLLGGLLIGITEVIFLYYCVFHGQQEVVPDQWIVASFLMYAGLSMMFFG